MSIGQTPIRFYLGEESRLVIEDIQMMNASIFKDAYEVALNIISDYIKNEQKMDRNNSSIEIFRQTADTIGNNIIAFVGDRGMGKSSCMLSIANMLRTINEKTDDKYAIEISKKCGTGFEILETIDPTFFEEKTNILEIVLGRMFSNFIKKSKKGNGFGDGAFEDNKDSLFRAFQEVKESVVQKNRCQINEEDCVDSLLKLTASVDLRDSFKKLIDKYLIFTKKDYLVICIDDLDLNTEYAYEMAEQIRKYLRQEKVIVLIALKIDQLKNAVQLQFENQYSGMEDKWKLNLPEMSSKYIDKLIPERNRVLLPNVNVWADSVIEVYKKNDGKWELVDDYHKGQTLKYYVVSLIFQKTRYLFYHSEGRICPIVPRNLRELRHLISTLCAMPDYTDESKMENNKEVFKEYFLKIWAPNNLNSESLSVIREIFEIVDPSEINKYVVQKLKTIYSDYLPSQWESSSDVDEEIGRIIDVGNVTYNVTLGDVLFLLSFLKTRVERINGRMLIFAIETFYSMRLYEYYDLMTEKSVINKRKELNKKIDYTIRKKTVLEGLNAYDILVGGAFVNTEMVNVLSPTKGGNRRDIRPITRESIDNLLNSIEEYGDPDGDKLRWVEFFVLFISRKNYDAKRAGISEKRWRNQDEVSYAISLNAPRLKFDVFSIFSNVVSIERQYKRFSSKLYELASKKEAKSLLNELKNYCYEHRGRRSSDKDMDDDSVEWDKNWNLMSWGAIRNIDVLESLVEYANSLNKAYHGENIEHISTFLRNISEFQIKTYDIITNNDRYTITFEFLKNVRNFIEDQKKDGNTSIFNKIYSSYYGDADDETSGFIEKNDDIAEDVIVINGRLYYRVTPRFKIRADIDDVEAEELSQRKNILAIREYIEKMNPGLSRRSSYKYYWNSIETSINIPLSVGMAKALYSKLIKGYVSYYRNIHPGKK